ncbi:MAG: metallophosphoesterase [Myxococcales bacterium]|nr:metallophosphoesterase [Myxococcales bacterium]
MDHDDDADATVTPAPAPAVAAALARASEATRAPGTQRAPEPARARRRYVIGDPQSSRARAFAVLARYDLLDQTGWLRPDVELISVGDHFDYGPAPREETQREGLALLAWLAAHSAAQVSIVLGNHDLARVGELWPLDDGRFAVAYARARAAYDARTGRATPALEEALLAEFPSLPTAEAAARDFSGFSEQQRALVWTLLRADRYRVAVAVDAGVLVCHAGLTRADARRVGLTREELDAPTIADALQTSLRAAIAAHERGPLVIPGLHEPGAAATGEGGGMFYHRPADPARHGEPQDYRGPRRRRFDPRESPRGLTQIVGHIGDAKCRELMPAWCDDAPPRRGVLRHLAIPREGAPRYRHGRPRALTSGPGDATFVFVDGGLHRVATEEYELLALDELAGP